MGKVTWRIYIAGKEQTKGLNTDENLKPEGIHDGDLPSKLMWGKLVPDNCRRTILAPTSRALARPSPSEGAATKTMI